MPHDLDPRIRNHGGVPGVANPKQPLHRKQKRNKNNGASVILNRSGSLIGPVDLDPARQVIIG